MAFASIAGAYNGGTGAGYYPQDPNSFSLRTGFNVGHDFGQSLFYGTFYFNLTIETNNAFNLGGASSGNYNNPTNWTAGVVPNADCVLAFFPQVAVPTTVNFPSGTTTIGKLVVDSTVSYTFAGPSDALLKLECPNGAYVIVDKGSHYATVATQFASDTIAEMSPGTSIYFSNVQNPASPQNAFTVQGGGTVELSALTATDVTADGSALLIDGQLVANTATAVTGTLQVGGVAFVGTVTTQAGTFQAQQLTATTATVNGGHLNVPGTANVQTLKIYGGTANFGQMNASSVAVSVGALNVSGAATANTIEVDGGHVLVGSVQAGTLLLNGGTFKIASQLPASTANVFGTVLFAQTSTGAFHETLDVGNGGFRWNYSSTGFDPIAGVQALIRSGYSNGTWTGTGITSSNVAAHIAANDGTPIVAVGYYDNASAGTVTVQYALAGDFNLDGVVYGEDFTILATNYNAPNTDWQTGDITNDGFTNSSDFNILGQNFNVSPSARPAAVVFGNAFDDSSSITPLLNFAATHGELTDIKGIFRSRGYVVNYTQAAVPEPTALGLVAVAIARILCHRRRRA